MQDLNVQYVLTSRLIPYSRNSKKHPPEQVAKIAAQIHEVGFLVPIVVDKDMVVVAGHGRLEAARELGLEQVPVIVADHLSEQQAMAWRIADNKVSESEWDMPMLTFELGTLERLGVDLTLSGFDMAEARSILSSFAGSDPSHDSSAPKDGAKEHSEGEFKSFEHRCPSCGFEFN